jgi:hypothetical protein
VNKNNQAPRSREAYIVQGIGPPERTLKINNADIDTLSSALLERMYYCKVDGEFVSPPVPEQKRVFKRLRSFRAKLLHYFDGSPSRISPEQFAEMYTGRKRTIYENAVELLTRNGVCRKDSRSDAFVKCEKVNPTKAPRCIQPRNPVYNVAVGTYLKHIEHKLYASIQRTFSSDTYIVLKGLNVVEIADVLHQKWCEFDSPVGIGLDATKFDMHVSLPMLRWEHSIYESLYVGDRELSKLLRWQRHNRGTGRCDDGKLTYKVDGRRFSGDMNTALGNCEIMCGLVYSYAKSRGVHIQLANNGDDCMVIMERQDMVKFSFGLDAWFLEMGFRMTVEPPRYVFEELEFCQMHPVYAGGLWKMVRNFDTAREKDSFSLLNLSNPSAYLKWLGAVGECGLALAGGVPIVQSFYQAMARVGLDSGMLRSVAMQSGFVMLTKRLEAKYIAVDDDARFSFYKAFGLTPDEQVALEEYYDGVDLSQNELSTDESIEYTYSAPY